MRQTRYGRDDAPIGWGVSVGKAAQAERDGPAYTVSIGRVAIAQHIVHRQPAWYHRAALTVSEDSVRCQI